ncbi:MAG: hypothetical protein E7525_07335 [Ruminococcaceae bacterium]|nr:hypothetical protein [Oscillospiraceae bacterium]
MAIFSEYEYLNRYTAGQTAVDRGEWRIAFDCFNDCKAYLERYRSWDTEEIRKLEKLSEWCNSMF